MQLHLGDSIHGELEEREQRWKQEQQGADEKLRQMTARFNARPATSSRVAPMQLRQVDFYDIHSDVPSSDVPMPRITNLPLDAPMLECPRHNDTNGLVPSEVCRQAEFNMELYQHSIEMAKVQAAPAGPDGGTESAANAPKPGWVSTTRAAHWLAANEEAVEEESEGEELEEYPERGMCERDLREEAVSIEHLLSLIHI